MAKTIPPIIGVQEDPVLYGRPLKVVGQRYEWRL
jgi:hypothetical protein